MYDVYLNKKWVPVNTVKAASAMVSASTLGRRASTWSWDAVLRDAFTHTYLGVISFNGHYREVGSPDGDMRKDILPPGVVLPPKFREIGP